MNQKKIKKIRKLVKSMSSGIDKDYSVGVTPYFDEKGVRLQVGVPTVLKAGCTKFITKEMKKEL